MERHNDVNKDYKSQGHNELTRVSSQYLIHNN